MDITKLLFLHKMNCLFVQYNASKYFTKKIETTILFILNYYVVRRKVQLDHYTREKVLFKSWRNQFV